ncbi:hypothetical protein ABW19_dt0207918 [Dactylella cylindrospora]|nr:hypothetical protein ABW19_dt0207918 [Dactylella cylindrospora]
MLKFLPAKLDQSVKFRVTSNTITSQVASMLIKGMFKPKHEPQVPLSIQPGSIDSLQPGYSCEKASAIYSTYGVGSMNPKWQLHLNESKPLFEALDLISRVHPGNDGFHKSFDHYFDNLSARQCHQKPLPCSLNRSSDCVTQEQADTVYRLGQYEYSFIYRDSQESLQAAMGSYGIWIAELAQNIRDSIAGRSKIKYRHNVAHDGSIARLLSILQIESMVWPGTGAEVVFEIYKKNDTDKHYVRILWGGRTLASSNPFLGKVDMLDVEVLLNYFEELVGRRAEKVIAFCKSP